MKHEITRSRTCTKVEYTTLYSKTKSIQKMTDDGVCMFLYIAEEKRTYK
jgi:hypothetical protein